MFLYESRACRPRTGRVEAVVVGAADDVFCATENASSVRSMTALLLALLTSVIMVARMTVIVAMIAEVFGARASMAPSDHAATFS
ncbi:hypothetical protein ACVOMS_25470 [Bradyrhizobium guangxiense]